jgi:hypothetical protein
MPVLEGTARLDLLCLSGRELRFYFGIQGETDLLLLRLGDQFPTTPVSRLIFGSILGPFQIAAVLRKDFD